MMKLRIVCGVLYLLSILTGQVASTAAQQDSKGRPALVRLTESECYRLMQPAIECGSEPSGYKAAIKMCTKIINRYPDCVTAYETRANLWRLLNQPQKAVRDIEQALSLGPTDSSWYIAALVHEAAGQWKKAVHDISMDISLTEKTYGRRHPDQSYVNRARNYIRLGKYELALRDIAQYPSSEALYLRGLIYERSNKTHLAATSYSSSAHSLEKMNGGKLDPIYLKDIKALRRLGFEHVGFPNP
jgi:tetratricopeptide (TPR) repeat protein